MFFPSTIFRDDFKIDLASFSWKFISTQASAIMFLKCELWVVKEFGNMCKNYL